MTTPQTERIAKPDYESLEAMMAAAAEVIRPPERITVAEASEKYRWLDNPGVFVGPMTHELTPYTVEIEETLTSTEYEAIVTVGPAQAGKTEPVLSWVTYSAICDPADMMIVSPTHNSSRDFSMRRLDRLYRDTKELKKKLLPGKSGQNVFDQKFRNGMLVTLSHPAISELSGKPVPRLWLTDFDRMEENVDGEGNAFDLARKRATTFKRFGMCVAESSPGFEIDNPKWIAKTPHEAPPTKGILALYNRGDRRRWYWKCPSCDEAFEPDFKLLRWPDEGDDMTRAEAATMECPHCAETIHPSEKNALNAKGRWIKDGQKWEKDGRISGHPYRSDIASFWLKGPAAGMADWKTLVLRFLQAEQEFDNTGSEEALKATTNTDQGEPYAPKAVLSARLPEELKGRAEKYGAVGAPVVPEDVRFLISTIDVQGGMKACFVVHVYGISPGGDIWHVDMFKIRKSKRKDEDGDPLPIDPAAYEEDWHVIVDEVIERTYPLSDGSGRRMQIKLVGCDSGGAEGVTTNAYQFYRWLKKNTEGYHERFQLLKGEPSKTASRYLRKFPDSQRKDRKAGARGDIPVGFINSDLLKDTVHAMLGRTEPGGGMIHFPHWAEDWLYMQLTAENRTAKGWVSTSRKRNEAFDLLYYCRALFIDPRIGAEKIDWDRPPGWADEWDRNPLVIAADTKAGFLKNEKRKRLSKEELGRLLG